MDSLNIGESNNLKLCCFINPDGKIGDGDIGDIKGGLYSTAPYGWLLCDGTAYAKADYPKLWDILPSAVKNTTNNTFTIDLRGEFLRGAGKNGGALGSHQNATAIPFYYSGVDSRYNIATNATLSNFDAKESSASTFATVTGTPGASSDYQNVSIRPTNTSVNWIIKAM